MNKRNRTVGGEESDATTYRPRTGDGVEEADSSVGAQRWITNDPAESFSKSVKKPHNERSSEEDESISKTPKKQRGNEDEVDGPQEGLVRSVKLSSMEVGHVSDDKKINLSKKKNRNKGGNNSTPGIFDSSIEEMDASDGGFSHSWKKWGKYKEDETYVDRDHNELSEFRTVEEDNGKVNKYEAEDVNNTNVNSDEKCNVGNVEVHLDEHEGEIDIDITLDHKSEGEDDCTIASELQKPIKKRRRRKKEDKVDMNTVDGLWATSLKGPHLDLMVSLKQLAEERLKSTGELSLSSCLTPAALRTIGTILEEVIKDRMASCESFESRQGSKQ